MDARPAYTIGTLVTDRNLYEQMRRSMQDRGFGDDCEFLTVDNSTGNQSDAYSGLNRILNSARGETIILCHQDVELADDGREQLEACLARLDQMDPAWAIAGNAGCDGYYSRYFWITEQAGSFRAANLPKRVYTLDEDFLVIKSEARLSFSRDLSGFHMYGPDICMVADVLGWSAYVIPFLLVHHSKPRSKQDEEKSRTAFKMCKSAFAAKWRRALRHREMETTITQLLIVGENCPKWYANLKFRWKRWIAQTQRPN